jgi:hypothetical protein
VGSNTLQLLKLLQAEHPGPPLQGCCRQQEYPIRLYQLFVTMERLQEQQVYGQQRGATSEAGCWAARWLMSQRQHVADDTGKLGCEVWFVQKAGTASVPPAAVFADAAAAAATDSTACLTCLPPNTCSGLRNLVTLSCCCTSSAGPCEMAVMRPTCTATAGCSRPQTSCHL